MLEKIWKFIKIILPNSWLLFIKKKYHTLFQKETLKQRALTRFLWFLIQSKHEYNTDSQNAGNEINKYEFKFSSQNGEDGILLYLFSKVGILNKRFVEIGIGDGRECNTANLILNFGWSGLLIDGDDEQVHMAKLFHQEIGSHSDLKIAQCFVTKENINQLLLRNGLEDEIDLLSIDIDGNDYWIWKVITVINPRVVVIEYNASLGYDKSIVIKYDHNFVRHNYHPSGWYHGASLDALVKLANSRGYILVGCESNGVNAFFVRKDIAQGILSEVSVQEGYFPTSLRLAITSTPKQFELIKHLDFEYV